MPEPVDQTMYNRIKKQVKRDIPKHSAYRSGIMVQKYKKAFAKKYGSKSPYKGKKTSKKGLGRWFEEEWRNQNGKVGYHSKSDIYRPMKRITKGTPVTHGELTKKEKRRARRTKRKKGYVYRFRNKTTKKRGRKWSIKYKRSINCNRPKGFSQKQYCKSFFKKKKKGGHHGFDLIGGKKSKINKTERIVKFKRGPRKSKYTAIVQDKKTKKKRSINFGHKDYPQFKDSTPLGYYSYKNHGTKKRKNAYYSRHSGTKLKAKAIRKEFRKSGGKYTPKLMSHIYLW